MTLLPLGDAILPMTEASVPTPRFLPLLLLLHGGVYCGGGDGA
jgi:hypothetical protein